MQLAAPELHNVELQEKGIAAADVDAVAATQEVDDEEVEADVELEAVVIGEYEQEVDFEVQDAVAAGVASAHGYCLTH